MRGSVWGILSLVGEQPIPVLVPLLYMEPKVAVFLHSKQTQSQAERMRRLVDRRLSTEMLLVPAYDVHTTQSAIEDWLRENPSGGHEVWLNFTGGTKPMALAAFAAAARFGIGLLYLESERRRSLVYRYRVASDGLMKAEAPEEVAPIIDLETYIRAHVDDVKFGIMKEKETKGARFAEVVAETLKPHVDELKQNISLSRGQIEIDIAVRCSNQIGIMEVKAGRINRDAIDQLNTAGGREYLGTYTKKFWVRSQPRGGRNAALDELATARNITVIELPSFEQTGAIDPQDAEKLVGEVRRQLTGEP